MVTHSECEISQSWRTQFSSHGAFNLNRAVMPPLPLYGAYSSLKRTHPKQNCRVQITALELCFTKLINEPEVQIYMFVFPRLLSIYWQKKNCRPTCKNLLKCHDKFTSCRVFPQHFDQSRIVGISVHTHLPIANSKTIHDLDKNSMTL